ncbi:helix-turn-helix domain-containing protein [Maridesulfovibrio ferrireducens]|uniref:helix-turn-helix domain-containing protein n=1 Tax=Maridesulfovibrio ferrireducens TaxID=246191 RepID=UPI001A276FBB|nr:helix-turn-helix domain-containing protein [Maridesulfovibrio ferrireducens]MBI9110271.1 helix-turn-helix domain-containing protein [Maridesulfovibrio ferrireducens]
MRMGLEKLHSVKEVAEAWGYSEKVIRQLIKVGQLKAVKVGKGYRIKDSDVKACLELAVVDGVHDEEV